MSDNLYISIEGPDNVGKTTLINNIKNYYNEITLHTLHYSSVKQSTNEKTIEYSKKLYTEMFNFMLMSVYTPNFGIICDRSHLGEMIYGPIYRGYSGEYVLEIEKSFKPHRKLWKRLLLITLYDEPENLIKRDDGLSFSTDLKKKTMEIDNFKNAHDKSLITNKLLLNIKNHNEAQTIKAVTTAIQNLNNSTF